MQADYEKPSRRTQWRERSQFNASMRGMTTKEMQDHRVHLAMSYKCEVSDISIRFEKIPLVYDEETKVLENPDDLNRIFLVYDMKCLDMENRPVIRTVYKIRIPVPEQIMQQANHYNVDNRVEEVVESIEPSKTVRKPMRPLARK